MDHARPVRSDAGATLTWHVGRYQVLPRHRVDVERKRMCDSLFTLAHLFRLSSRVPRTSIALSLSSLRSCRATLVSPCFCTMGDTPLHNIAPMCAILALPLPSPSPRYRRCQRQQVDDVYHLGFIIMQLFC